MSYDKDWEVHLALNNPLDPIHGYIEEQLKDKDKEDISIPQRDCLTGVKTDSQQKHG